MNAQQLKNAILQEAIEGRLVPQDPNDEPASVLLARIRQEKERLVKEGKLKKKDLEVKPISEDEIPFEIPDSWKWVRIKNLIHGTGAGKSPNCEKRPKSENEWGVITTTAIQYCAFLPSENKVLPSTFVVNELQVVKDKDLLITRAGPKNRTGIVCVVDKPCDRLILSDKTVRIDYIRGYSNPLYLMYALNNPSIHDAVMSATVGMAESQVNISQSSIQNIVIPLPPLAEQHRIVAKIEELLPKVEEYGKAQDALNKLNAELPERLKKSILQEAIEGRLVPQDPNDEPASVLLAKIRQEKAQLVRVGKLKKKDLIETPVEEDETPFSIPNSWKWIRFGDLVSTSTGKTPARGDNRYWGNNDYPWVSISDMKQGEVVYRTKEFVSTKAANECFHNEISKSGTLIMSFKLTVGRTSILGVDAYHNEAIISIKPYADGDNYTRDYLSYILPVVTTWGDSKDAIKGKTLNAKSIYNLLIPLPPQAEQHRIVEKLEQLLGKIEQMKK